MRYRAEIDGLRALAVMSVIFYHADFHLFSGGYVGVDVFFVISGYLITSIILNEKNANIFSLINFYERRARRILPALFLVMLTVLLFAWFYYLPSELKVFGLNLSAAAVFLANIYTYLFDGDYFGVQSEYNPILHLWSLAVEEQFYIFFPLVLLATLHFDKKITIICLSIIAFISFTFAQLLSIHNTPLNFYLLQTRAWELLIGSFIAFYYVNRKIKYQNYLVEEAGSLIGFQLIVYAVLAYDKQTPFPSFYTLAPTIGAALIIIFGNHKTLVGKMLGSKLFSSLGLISYSAYLWHQPVFVFARKQSMNELSTVFMSLLILTSIMFAYITWRYIEKPFRNKNRFKRNQIFIFAVLGFSFFLVFGIVGYFNGGYPKRDPLFTRLEFNNGLSRQCNGNYSINSTCTSDNNPTTAIFGNSYAMHLMDGFMSTYPNIAFVQLTQDSCSPYKANQIKRFGKNECNNFYESSMETLKKNKEIKNVIISSDFGNIFNDNNINNLKNTIQQLKENGKNITLVGPTPSNGKDFGKCFVLNKNSLEKCNFMRNSIKPEYTNKVKALKEISYETRISFIDLTEIICQKETCFSSNKEIFIYRDDGHLSREGSRYVIKEIANKLEIIN